PDNAQYVDDLARANLALGNAWHRNYQSAGDRYVARGQELVAILKKKFPGREPSSGVERELSYLKASRYTDLPHDAAALKQLEQECRAQLAAAEAESENFPESARYQTDVGDWLGRLSRILTAANPIDELEPVVLRQLEIHQRLAAQHPHVPEYQKNLGWALYHAGLLYYGTDRPVDALVHLRDAIAVVEAMIDKYPQNIKTHVQLAELLRGC